ncbi:hypothetical protein ACFL4G_09850, partial [Thermodesulfobacteriota bacterium]
MSERNIRRILLLRSPSYENMFFPPLALGVLTSFLRDLGYETVQHDLNGRWKLARMPRSHPLASLRDAIRDNARIHQYLLGEPDKYLESAIESILEDVDVSDADLVLLSPDIPFFESAKLAVLIAKTIKDRKDVPIVVGGEYQQFKPIDTLFEFLHTKGIIDYQVHGPGENALAELIAMLDGSADPGSVPGLVWMDGPRVKKNPFTLNTRPI